MSDPQHVRAPAIRLLRPKLLLSYGRRDAKPLADQLNAHLTEYGYQVWQDTREVFAGTDWQREIKEAIRTCDVIVALLSPHSVRRIRDSDNTDDLDSICIAELAFARHLGKPIVPVMAISCEPPLPIYHLDYVDLRAWQQSPSAFREGFSRLVDGIEAAHRGQVPYRRWFRRMQPYDCGPYLAERRLNFTGRKWLFDEIDAWLLIPANQQVLLITSDPGVGKTALVAELVYQNLGGRVLAYHCCRADTRETLKPGRFVRSLAAMIASRIAAYAEVLETSVGQDDPLNDLRCEDDPGGALEEGILTPLHALAEPPNDVRYILVDALDEALLAEDRFGHQTIVHLLANSLNRLPLWVRIIATSRKDPDVLSKLSALQPRELRADDRRNRDDLDTYIGHRLAHPTLAAKLTEARMTQSEASRLLAQKAEGNFLVVKQTLDGVLREDYGFDRLDQLPPGLYGPYEAFFDRHFADDAAYAPARAVLQVIVAAREPVPEVLLAQASGVDVEEKLPRLLRRLSPYVPSRTKPNGERVYAVYHKSFSDWLTDPTQRGSRYYAALKQGHKRLADACLRNYRLGARAMSAYSVMNLPAHLAEAEQWNEIITVLADFEYLQARLECSSPALLIHDFERLDQQLEIPAISRELSPIHDALRLAAHCIADDPTQFAGQMIGRLTEADVRDLGEVKNDLVRCLVRQAQRYDSATWLCPLSRSLTLQETTESLSEEGHSGWVLAVAVFGDGRTCVSASADRTLKIWDFQCGTELRTLKGHNGSIHAVAVSADGRLCVSGSSDRTLKVWDIQDGAEMRTLRGHTGWVRSVAILSDGRTAISGSDDRTLKAWRLDTGVELRTFRGHTDAVRAVAVAPGERLCVSASDDGTLKVWDLETGMEVRTLKGHDGPVRALAVTPDGCQVVSTSYDRTLKSWDLQTGDERRTFKGHSRVAEAVAVTPDGCTVISGSHDHTVKLWDLESGAELCTFGGHDRAVHALAVTPGGQYALSASGDVSFKVWNLATRTEVRTLKGNNRGVRAVAVTPDGRQALSALADMTLSVWDVATCMETRRLKGHSGWVNGVAVTPDGRHAISGADDKMLKVWDLESGKEIRTLEGHRGPVRAVAVTPDGRQVLSASWDHTLKMWDLDSGVELHTLKGHRDFLRAVTVTPDGRFAISASDDETLKVWDLRVGEEVNTLKGHLGPVVSVAVTPDGGRAISGSWDATMKLWDLQSGESVATFNGHFWSVTAVAVTQDGCGAISASYDATLKVWNLDSGRIMATFTGNGPMSCCTIAPDGRIIIAGDATGAVHFLDLRCAEHAD